MKKQIKKNINQRYCFKNHENLRLILKTLTQNTRITSNRRWKLQTLFLSLPLKSSLTQIKNRCIFSGRSRGIFRFFKMSRLNFRRLASSGMLPGIKKYSW